MTREDDTAEKRAREKRNPTNPEGPGFESQTCTSLSKAGSARRARRDETFEGGGCGVSVVGCRVQRAGFRG